MESRGLTRRSLHGQAGSLVGSEYLLLWKHALNWGRNHENNVVWICTNSLFKDIDYIEQGLRPDVQDPAGFCGDCGEQPVASGKAKLSKCNSLDK